MQSFPKEFPKEITLLIADDLPWCSLSLFTQSCPEFASEPTFQQKKDQARLWLKNVKKHPPSLRTAPMNIRSCRETLRVAIQFAGGYRGRSHGSPLQYASEQLKDDAEMVKEVVWTVRTHYVLSVLSHEHQQEEDP